MSATVKPPPRKKEPDSFVSSDKHTLNGKKLQPWTPSRYIAAQAMGMLYPRIGEKGHDQFKRTQVYPGAVKDVIIALWLCSVTEDEVDDADASPEAAYRKARAWAIGLGLHKIEGDAFWNAYGQFADIFNEVDQSRTTPAETDDDPKD